MNDLTLYDLMADDYLLYAGTLDCGDHIKVIVSDADGKTVYQEISHINAWESLVDFAKQVLTIELKRMETKK